MFTEVMIFAAFYAVAFMAHAFHAHVTKAAPDVVRAHRFAAYAAVVVKAGAAALHEYAVHFVVYSGYVLPPH